MSKIEELVEQVAGLKLEILEIQGQWPIGSSRYRVEAWREPGVRGAELVAEVRASREGAGPSIPSPEGSSPSADSPELHEELCPARQTMGRDPCICGKNADQPPTLYHSPAQAGYHWDEEQQGWQRGDDISSYLSPDCVPDFWEKYK